MNEVREFKQVPCHFTVFVLLFASLYDVTGFRMRFEEINALLLGLRPCECCVSRDLLYEISFKSIENELDLKTGKKFYF